MVIMYATEKYNGLRLKFLKSSEEADELFSKTLEFLNTVDFDLDSESVHLHCHKCAGTTGSALDITFQAGEDGEYYQYLSSLIVNRYSIPGDILQAVTIIPQSDDYIFCPQHRDEFEFDLSASSCFTT